MISLLIVGYLLADDSNGTKDYGTPFIEPKIYYINSTVKTGSATTKSDAFSVGGRYGYISPSFEGLSGGTMVYTTNKIDNKDENPAKNSTSILKSNDKDSHHYIGQAYLAYKNETIIAKIGRLEIETPLVGSNTRFLGNTYEAINIEATPVKRLKLSAIYISRANAGTISNVLPKNSPFGLVGYGVGREVGEFVSVDKYILGSNTKESISGLYAVGMSWEANEYIKLTAWDYYYDDILNSFYPEASFEVPIEKTKLFGSINYHIQNDVGENLMGKATNKEIDNKMLQAKLGAQYESNKLTLGYARTPGNKDALYNGLIITPFNAENM